MNKNQEEVQLLSLDTGRQWPYHKGKKALSASTLTKVLREIVYKEVPEHILLRAAERGKNFHEIVQEFVQSGNYPPFIDLAISSNLSKLNKQIHETINFLKKNRSAKLGKFLGGERLHYVFYRGELLATYLDLEFQDCIIELKTNSISVSNLNFNQDKICLDSFDKLFNNPFSLLVFEVQLLIQYLCTGKDIYLLWSTGEGVIFNKFQLSDYSLKLLDMLIDLVRNEAAYSPNAKKIIVQEIVNKYYPHKKLVL